MAPIKWITKNGKRIPLTETGGGGRSGTIMAVGVIAAGAIGFGGATGELSSALGSAGGASSSSVGQSISARKAEGRRAARKGSSADAWRRMGMRELKQTTKRDLRCVGASFGQVQQFFLHTPCTSLVRRLFAVGDDGGNSAAISIAWVGFRTRGQANNLKDLIDVYGTGDIKPLASSLLDLAEVTFTGRYYHADRKGSTLTIAEAETVAGRVDPELLKAMAEVAAELPRP
jgi:PPE-repeat protein